MIPDRNQAPNEVQRYTIFYEIQKINKQKKRGNFNSPLFFCLFFLYLHVVKF
ncbi:hypothetical protein HMPREF0766_12300 [Sphingobacterium spiritivorum ATCC 33861]|uniref:Uncharacterized protein n=1 Tax=Sphingobacterium spiritivorum ATCC 33861 TaxID=525373 RepID=D7VMT0_SPHSI|nr:hypothetical protein HMPREF0766_12300 [Sphingobacterium spiritivorum ATCC 33861]